MEHPAASQQQQQQQQADSYDKAGLFSRLTFGWVSPLVDRANTSHELEEHDSQGLTPARFSSEQLTSHLGQFYQLKNGAQTRPGSRRLMWALVTCHSRTYFVHACLAMLVSALRLTSPIILRQYLLWLTSSQGDQPRPDWHGYLLAIALGVSALAIGVVQHQLPWYGTMLGFLARQEVIGLVHDKLLRLNAASVSALSPGYIINLVSNDVRRFDDACFYWVHTWVGPLELCMVLLMVSLELDPVAAIAGISAMLAIIPLQALLVQPVASIRRETAQCTDQRVRLTSEAIQGALACKMLGWEDALTQELTDLRSKEAHNVARMVRIRASNMALQFVVPVLVTFSTFAVYRARQPGAMQISSVFYAVALLQIPRRTMSAFVSGVQAFSEVRVSLQRFESFLHSSEPPQPMYTSFRRAQPGSGDTSKAVSKMPGQEADTGRCSPLPTGPDIIGTTCVATLDTPTLDAAAGGGPQNGHAAAAVSSVPVSRAVPVPGSDEQPPVGYVNKVANQAPGKDQEVIANLQVGTVALTGASYDWARPFGAASSLMLSGQPAAAGKLPDGVPKTGRVSTEGCTTAQHVTLSGVQFLLRPGELLGVCGEVGAGKSSLIAALLGELQPLPAPAPVPAAGAAPNKQMETATCIGLEAGSGSVVVEHGAQQDRDQDLLKQLAAAAAGGPVVKGSLAYCSQIPWIVAGSLKDNVLFGGCWDADRFDEVLSVCALKPDVARLPAGIMTELGERGINLSGGQKARLALARAAYSCSDVVLLDDPLSAVDPNVGRTLFNACIGPRGIMQGATRVLVTHQRQYLPLCDRVLVLRHGQMAVLGTWAELQQLSLPELATPDAEDAAVSLDVDTSHASPAKSPLNQQPDAAPARVATDEATDTTAKKQAGVRSAESGSSSDSDVRSHSDSSLEPVVVDDAGARVSSAATAGPLEVQVEADTPDAVPAGVFSRTRTQHRDVALPEPPTPGHKRQPLAWVKSFGPRVGGALGGDTSLAYSFRRARSFWRDEPAVKGDADSITVKADKAPVQQGQLVKAEGRVIGTVSWRVYGRYLSQMGPARVAGIMVVVLCGQAAYIGAEWWLSLWSKTSPAEQVNTKWLLGYGLFVAMVVVFGLSRAFMFFAAALRASSRLHNSMISRLLRAPLAFFHTNPVGRVLNRFSKDLGSVDDQLPVVMFDSLQCGLLVLGAFVLVTAAVPYVLPVFLPLGVIFWWIRERYVTASREIKRWEAVTRSPVYAQFSSTLKGLATIRAYGAQARLQALLLQLLTANGHWNFAFIGTGRWIGFRLDLVSGFLLMTAALIGAAAHKQVNPALLGLALSHVLQMTGIMQWVVRQTAEVENNMTCTERMLEYTELPQEPPRVCEGGGAPPAGWPASGALVWEGVWSRYRPDLPPVLQDISFSLQPGTVCGVVGRTGSGKSSLALTLFRLIEVTKGRVLLDGVDVARIGLDALRSQLAIIPQDPVLFSGTVRYNLDLWGQHSDAELWEVLTRVQLKRCVQAMGGLAGRMAEAGDNLSVGQRQLFCLARALLQRAKVLVLDEATANVDRETDALIHGALDAYVRPGHVHVEVEQDEQQLPARPSDSSKQVTAGVSGAVNGTTAVCVGSEQQGVVSHDVHSPAAQGMFSSGCVLLVIAHRIDTILDSDHLLVLGDGKLLEQGAPHDLSSQPEGVFAGMVTAARQVAANGGAGDLA